MNAKLAAAFQAADAAARHARLAAHELWEKANADGCAERGELIAEAQRLDAIAEGLEAGAESAADAFIRAGGVR